MVSHHPPIFFVSEQIFCPKKLWFEIFFEPIKFQVLKFFWPSKNFWSGKKVWVQNKFGKKLDQNKLWAKKNFDLKKILKDFWVQKILGLKKNVRSEKILGPKTN